MHSEVLKQAQFHRQPLCVSGSRADWVKHGLTCEPAGQTGAAAAAAAAAAVAAVAAVAGTCVPATRKRSQGLHGHAFAEGVGGWLPG